MEELVRLTGKSPPVKQINHVYGVDRHLSSSIANRQPLQMLKLVEAAMNHHLNSEVSK